jgi:hypothetical protein
MVVTDRIQGTTTIIITPTGGARSTPTGTTSAASNTTTTRVPAATTARGMGTTLSTITPPVAAMAPVTTTPGTSRRSGTETQRHTVTAAHRTAMRAGQAIITRSTTETR